MKKKKVKKKLKKLEEWIEDIQMFQIQTLFNEISYIKSNYKQK